MHASLITIERSGGIEHTSVDATHSEIYVHLDHISGDLEEVIVL